MQASEEARLEDLESLAWDMLEATRHRYPKSVWQEWRRRYTVAGYDEESAEAVWPAEKPERDWDMPFDAYNEDGVKVCVKCGEAKPKSAFYRRHDSRDGMQSYCSDCAKEAVSTASKTVKKVRHKPKYSDLIGEAETRTMEVYG